MAVKTVGEIGIRVVIADASSFVRLVLADILGNVPEVEVVAAAVTGDEVIKLVKIYKPDVLLMDLDLPQNSRLFTLHRLASECPVPVLLLNSKNRELSPVEKQKLHELGVYGFVNKPANILKPQLRTIKEELVQKLYQHRQLKTGNLKVVPGKEKLLMPILPAPELQPVMHLHPVKVAVLGASTGGAQQIEMLVQWLSADFKGCLLIAIHMPDTFVRTFVKRIKTYTSLKISLARSGMLVEAGRIIMAPGGRDMFVEEAAGIPGMAKIMLTKESESFYDSPSIDRLMTSVANFYEKDSLGIILTGMGTDGTAGLTSISEAGGKTIVQDQHQAGVFGMAKSAISKGVAHQVLPLAQIVGFIEKECNSDHGRIAGVKHSGA